MSNRKNDRDSDRDRDSNLGCSTIESLHKWYNVLVEKYGWLIIARNCKSPERAQKKTSQYIEQLENFIEECTDKIKKLTEDDRKNELRILENNISYLLIHIKNHQKQWQESNPDNVLVQGDPQPASAVVTPSDAIGIIPSILETVLEIGAGGSRPRRLSKKITKKGTVKGSKKGTVKGSKKGTRKRSKKGTRKRSKKGTRKRSKKGTRKRI
jgi:hypothetical protein